MPLLTRVATLLAFSCSLTGAAELPVDFNREIRPILSQNCFLCHGPDAQDRKGKLRLDIRADALKAGSSGKVAIVPGDPDQSELIARITHPDPEEAMPPAKSGKKLSQGQVNLLRRWISQGAKYATHWAYAKPIRPNLPEAERKEWPRNSIDYFILDRLQQEKLQPTAEADRYSLIRRVALDLTGLPPTIAEADHFVNDSRPGAYERMVDHFLGKESFGEHWARVWLDLARYADSAGYADDPLRSIWRYRDYVIRSFNENKPFDDFTIEQLAGDLLPDCQEEDLVATAFHRNTMTNNEGGTNDEEFRNAAVVDRVNTTMAVWMGTSMACAQCHSHKYDPITQDEYFQFMAFLDNTEDADRPDESPTLKFFTRAQENQREKLQRQISETEEKLRTPTPELLEQFANWQNGFPRQAEWRTLQNARAEIQRKSSLRAGDDGALDATTAGGVISLNIEAPADAGPLTALRLESPERMELEKPATWKVVLVPPNAETLTGRFVRIELPGQDRILSLAEVQVFSGSVNAASRGTATQSSTEYGADASRAIDGKTDGDFQTGTTTHTSQSENPWWELDLKESRAVNRIAVWNRTDNKLQSRLKDFRVALLDDNKQVVWKRTITDAPNPVTEFNVDGLRTLELASSFNGGLTVLLATREDVPAGSKIRASLEFTHAAGAEPLSRFKFKASPEAAFLEYNRVPSEALARLAVDDASTEDLDRLRKDYLRHVAPVLAPEREKLASLRKELEAIKPNTVPIMRELAGEKRRKTHFQFRGNYLDTGKVVTEAVPAAFNPWPENEPRNRLGLARWLVSPENPLTPRVLANRFWEQIFGIGLVRTSEEFGSQGELPSHPELLDWLAVELVESGWNIKEFLKTLVTSAAYRQSSRVTPELAERDPDNRLLARGPRFRISAETVRDQALAVAGLLSPKMHGPSVKPPQPSSGLSAAFGSSVDWKTSEGEDRFRRGLYTEWRRTSPYPSMSTFDAPNREVCTLRRSRTSTPLQALVTLNDPVYLEAAQGLARRMAAAGESVEDRIRHGFRLCVTRPPADAELRRLAAFYEEARSEFERDAQAANHLAADPLGRKLGCAPADFAALATVANVLLNLDETLMKL